MRRFNTFRIFLLHVCILLCSIDKQVKAQSRPSGGSRPSTPSNGGSSPSTPSKGGGSPSGPSPSLPNNTPNVSPVVLPNPTRPTTSTRKCNNDGVCLGTETCTTCPNDCKRYGSSCGDGICVPGETCQSCPQDCAGSNSDTYCCGDDVTGCSDSRCRTAIYLCVTTLCEGQSGVISLHWNVASSVIVLVSSFYFLIF